MIREPLTEMYVLIAFFYSHKLKNISHGEFTYIEFKVMEMDRK